MIGTALGPYQIVDKLGAGGMGEVYRATDTRLKRQVAIKVLPSALTADPDRLARFQREAEVLASLNHPNIAALYGLEEAQGVKALVMELVEGPTLADRLAHGPMPIAEALPIAAQIADALAAAHEQNVIHRDLKPANVKVRPDGTVKVLDFGLAKALDQGSGIGEQGSGKIANSPTITSPAMTMHGVILGTAAYMSPEQAGGRPVDRRTDLWAFGVVLFEMVTGRRLFDGESVSHVIAAVLKDEPDWSALPADTPAGIRRLLRRCLERDRQKRWPDAATAGLECEEAQAPHPDDRAATTQAPRRWTNLLAPAGSGVVAGALAAAAIAFTAWPALPPAPTSTRFAIELPADQVFTRSGRHLIALSPDASRLAYVANSQLYLRSFDELDAAPIDGTANADPSQPVFSPDGQWIAFWSNNNLKKVPTDGGTAVTLASMSNPYGLSWDGDRILAGQGTPTAIIAVPANGGPPESLVQLDDAFVQSPQSIEDGRAILFTLRGGSAAWDDAAIVIHDLTTGARTTLIDRGTDGRLLSSGQLVYSRAGTLFAAAYDARRRAVSGTPAPVQQKILQSVGGFTGASQAVFSSTGTLAYVPDDNFGADRVLLWMNQKGETQLAKLPPRPHMTSVTALALSPDSKQIAVNIRGASSSQSDIWIGDLARNVFTRLSSTGSATDPIWAPDGRRVCYVSGDSLLCQPSDGSAPAVAMLTRPRLNSIAGWSRDGASILLVFNGAKTGDDLWLAPNQPPFDAAPLIASPGNDDSAVLSPDDRWVAYVSDESGTDEVYVRPFPAVNQGRWQVSAGGGLGPRWSRDGRELYYFGTRTAGSSVALTLMAAKVLSGTTFGAASPEVVASLPLGVRGYDTALDGRFILSVPAGSTVPGAAAQRQSIVVVQNWSEELRAKVPR